jgi:hypothetical protein
MRCVAPEDLVGKKSKALVAKHGHDSSSAARLIRRRWMGTEF